MQRTTNFPPLNYRLAALALGALFSIGVVGCGSKTDGGPATCDGNALLTKYGCVGAGCHSGSAPAANLDLASANVGARLVGVSPPGGGPTGQVSLCAGATPPHVYLMGTPATGLFLQKLDSAPPCGVQMPQIGAKVTSADRACFQMWADGLTAATNGGG
jgi:hypothetical protein